MGLTAGKGRRVKQISKKREKDQKKKNPREVLKREEYLYRVLQSWSLPLGGRWCCPLPENSPLPETSPLPENSPLPEDSPLAFRGRPPGAPGGAALLLHKPTVRCQQRKSIHARLTAESEPYTYAGGCSGEQLPGPARLSRTHPLLSRWVRPR